MSTLLNDCKECGLPKARSDDDWLQRGATACCGVAAVSFDGAQRACDNRAIERLKARIAELERIVGPRLRVWELSGGDVWVVAHTEEGCWRHLEDQHGNPDEIAELKENGDKWIPLPDDKKITMMVDADGDVCGYDDGAPCAMPAWVWAVRHGAGFLGETE